MRAQSPSPFGQQLLHRPCCQQHLVV